MSREHDELDWCPFGMSGVARCEADKVLKAENAELREQVTQLQGDWESERDYADQMEAKEKKAVDENAKLRELCVDMRKALIHGNCYRWCEFNGTCDGKCQYIDRMRELGVLYEKE